MELSYFYGCRKCKKFIEVKAKTGFFDFAKFNDEDYPDFLNRICTCKKR